MKFYNGPITVVEYENVCVEYYGAELYEVLDKHMDDGSTLLELGCGPGNDIKFLHKKYKVTGSDEFLCRCKERFSDVTFFKIDAISINIDNVFDCVFSNKVLHHLF